MNMRTTLRAAAAPLLLGCILLLAAGFGSAGENLTCGADQRPQLGTKKKAAAEPGIAIRKAEEAGQDEWTYNIINTGNVKLTNVRVTDDRFAAISCQQDALDVGESMACTASEPSKAAEAASMGCAVADHVVISEVGVMVTTKGDCADEAVAF